MPSGNFVVEVLNALAKLEERAPGLGMFCAIVLLFAFLVWVATRYSDLGRRQDVDHGRRQAPHLESNRVEAYRSSEGSLSVKLPQKVAETEHGKRWLDTVTGIRAVRSDQEPNPNVDSASLPRRKRRKSGEHCKDGKVEEFLGYRTGSDDNEDD